MPRTRTRQPPPIAIEKALADPKTHALGVKLMDADLAGNGNGLFEYQEARHLDAKGRAAYAKYIGETEKNRTPAASKKPAAKDPSAALRGLESPALADAVSAYVAKHPKEAKAIATFFAKLGDVPESAAEISGKARNQLFADASLFVRGYEKSGELDFPSKGLGKVFDRWLTEAITNTGSARTLDDPAYPRDFVRVASWLAQRVDQPVDQPLSPASKQLVAAFAMIGDASLTSGVETYLRAHPEESQAIAGFFAQQGVPHGPSALNPKSRLALYADAMMLLRGQATTPEGLSFPSKGLGAVIADWIDTQILNTGNAGPSSPLYPWKMVQAAEWLVKGAYAKQSDDFWKSIGPHL